MPSTYEFWLVDDTGRRITLLQDMAYFSYSRTLEGFGTLMIGFPYSDYEKQVFPIFEPDWRIDVWRSPAYGVPLRREQTYLLRMYKIYTRESDNVKMIALYCRDLKDLLRRRWIIQPAGYSQTLKEDYIDDMMKEIVSEQMLYGSCVDEEGVADNTRAFPEGEFTVQGEVSLGPLYSDTFADRNVLDVLNDLYKASRELQEQDPLTYSRIYFDVVPVTYDVTGLMVYILDEDGLEILDESGNPILDESSAANVAAVQGMQFMTWADLRGKDRTANSLVFSIENNNLDRPYLSVNHNDEENSIIVKGFGRGDSRPVDIVDDDSRIGLSRWNRCEGFQDASTEPDQANLADYAYSALYDGSPREELSAVFLNVDGSADTPRSLYGMDWDLGDLLPVEYAGKQFNVEVMIVYVAVDEGGVETITGRNEISASDQ